MSLSINELSNQAKDIQKQLLLNDQSKLMLDALRGKNINDDDKQNNNINMQIVEIFNDKDDSLPTYYDVIKLENYFNNRPKAVLTRVWQVISTSGGYLIGLLLDILTGNTQDMDIRRAKELRNTIVSLGPFFIKLGQALSIRPDILSPRAMIELQQLCDKVPCFDNALAMKTIEEELNAPINKLFSNISADPVAAASLGQVYKAVLLETNEEVAVKVQRPYVLETVSLDLYLVRKIGLFLRNFPKITNRLDIVSILDEFAQNFYQELDYNNECLNGIRIANDMKKLPMVVIPKNYPDYTSRRVHVAQWIYGEKLSQSKANDVSALVNLGVITYLTQLLDTGFFHADPHPGNMLRTPDGKLVIIDFGLMTQITDDQKYGMIEAIAHLIHRDYDEIGNDFVKLDFIPKGVDTRPIVPALTRVFEAALAGGGAKSINFQELAADLAEITFTFPFKIPPYFALVIRAISVLEGIALVGNPEFAIVDEAYPYISRRLLTDDTPRLRAALRYMIYGKNNKVLDVDRVIDMLQALEKFVAVKDYRDGTAFKVDGKRGDVFVGKSGDSRGTKALDLPNVNIKPVAVSNGSSRTSQVARDALKFFFSSDGLIFREFLLDELTNAVDAISRQATRELIIQRLGINTKLFPSLIKALAPKLTDDDKRIVDSISKLINFLTGSDISNNINENSSNIRVSILLSSISKLENREKIRQLLPILQEFAPNMREYGLLVTSRLIEKSIARMLKKSSEIIFGDNNNKVSSVQLVNNKSKK